MQLKTQAARRILAAVFALLLLPPAAGAGAQGPQSLTLAQAVNRALAHNHNLSSKQHAAHAADWSLRQARGQLLPSISLQSIYRRLDGETVRRANAFGTEMTMYFPDSAGMLQPYTITIPQSVFRHGYETSVSAELLLFNPSVWNAASFASASRDMAKSELETTRQATAHLALRAFVELLKIHSMLQIQEEHLAQARENRDQADRLFHVGRYAEADVLRWQVVEARQSQLLIRLQSARRVAALALENFMGDPPVGTTSPDTLLPEPLICEIRRFRLADDASWDAFMSAPLDTVIARNPQLRILDDSIRMTEIEHHRRLISFLPNMVVSGSYGWQHNNTIELDGDKAWSVSAILSLPLFSGFGNVSARQASKYKVMEARDSMQEARRSILLAAEAARTDIRSYVEQLRLTETTLVSARRNYEIRKNSFSLGRLSNLEWIDAHLVLRVAEQNQASAYYDLVMAVADYYQAMGMILALVEETKE